MFPGILAYVFYFILFCLDSLSVVRGVLYRITFLFMVIFFVFVLLVWYESTILGIIIFKNW